MASPATAGFLSHWRNAVDRNVALLAYLELRGIAGGVYMPSQAIVGTVAQGSHRLTGSGFTASMVGGEVGGALRTGGYVPAGCYIASYVSSTLLMLSDPGTAGGASIAGTLSAGQVVRFANRPLPVISGNYWQSMIVSADPVRHIGDYLSPGPNLIPASLTLALSKIAYQTTPADATLVDSLRDYQWEGSKIILYMYDEDFATIGEAPFQIYSGVVNKVRLNPEEGAVIECLQDRSWNRNAPLVTVDRASYPNVPEGISGVPVPLIRGDWRAPGMRTPWSDNYTHKQNHIDCHGGGLVVPGVLIDPGTGGAKARVLFAGHPLAPMSAGAPHFFADLGGKLCRLDPSALTITNGPIDYFVDIADEGLMAYAPVVPVDVRTTIGTRLTNCTNPRNALNVLDETTYALMNHSGAGAQYLALILPNESMLGKLVSLEIVVGYSSTQNAAARGYIWAQGASTFSAVASFPVSATPTTARFALAAPWADPNWSFGGSSDNWDLIFDTIGTTSGQLKIYFAALSAKFRIQQSIVVPEKSGQAKERGIEITGRRQSGRGKQVVWGHKDYFPGAPAIYELSGAFYANLLGLTDNVSGSYSGDPSALLERLPDIAQEYLVSQGGAVLGDLNRATGSFGSFVDARIQLKTREGSEYVGCSSVARRTTVLDIVRDLATESLSQWNLDPYTGKHLWIPWRRDPATSYDYIVGKDDVLAISVDETSETDIAQSIRVRYGPDTYTNDDRYEAFVDDSVSSMDYVPNAVNDQVLVVVAGVNDKLNVFDGTTNLDLTLEPGIYQAIGLAREVQRQLRPYAGGAGVSVGYGFHVKAGYNDKIDFVYNASSFVATLNPGAYSSEGIAIEVQRAMRLAANKSTGFTFVSVRSTGNFLLQTTGLAIQLKTATGANFNTSAMGMLGYSRSADTISATSLSSGIVYHEDKFWFQFPTTGKTIKWATGASAATSCAGLMGYLNTTDDAGSFYYPADNVRGDRVLQAAASVRRYGEKRDARLASKSLRVFNVAGDLRDRAFDARVRTRIQVTFATTKCPDLQRGRVMECDASLDQIIRYPKGDGSWAGKRFWVVEMAQHLGPSWHQEIVMVEA